MKSRKHNSDGRFWLGGILILLGVLFLLDNYNVLSFTIPDYLFQWQVILIIIGLILLASKNTSSGLTLVIIGLIFLFPDFWPLLLIGLGIYFLMNQDHQRSKEFNHFKGESDFDDTEDTPGDYIDEMSLFGGGTKNISSENFKGGKITAIFGGTEIRLNRCKLADGENVIDIVALFGGATLVVPQDWYVIVKLVPLFGGFSDKRVKDPHMVYGNDKVLVVKGVVLFGGGEIKSYY